MSNLATNQIDTIAHLLEQLGGVPATRVLLKPTPGKATEAHLLHMIERKGRLCELVDGTLVEKPRGYDEGSLAMRIGHLLASYLDEHDLGNLSGSDGTIRLMPGLVRVPDVSFTRWNKFPEGRRSAGKITNFGPDLAIEILSESNTKNEMRRKVREYFLSGTELVWLVDPSNRTITVYTAPDTGTSLSEDDTLDGGGVLPGFTVSVERVFRGVPLPPKKPSRRKKPRTAPD